MSTGSSLPRTSLLPYTVFGSAPAAVSFFVFKPQLPEICCLPVITLLRLIMAFFAGGSNPMIYGGNFINNSGGGTLNMNDWSRHSTNINSKNKSTSNMVNSHNDNSTAIGEQCNGFTFNGRLMIWCCKVAVMNRCMHRCRRRCVLDPQVSRYLWIWVRNKSFSLPCRLSMARRRLRSTSASTLTIQSSALSLYCLWCHRHQSRLL